MNRRWISSAASTALALTCVSARAAEADEMIVTATRYAIAQDQVLPATSVIGTDELQRSLAPDITDVLRFHSGLEFGRNGGPGQNTSMFMRGTDSNHTLVLIDGVRMNPATIGGAALQTISPALVERIEIVKGPRSTLYGTDAIGGVVQIFTRAQHANGFQSEASYGEYATVAGAASGGWGGERAHVGFGVSYLETDGFAPRTNDARGGQHDNLSFNLAGSLQAGPGNLSASYWHATSTTDYVDFSSRTFDNALYTQDNTNSAASLAYAWDVGVWSSKLELGHMTDELDQGSVEDALGRFESADYAHTRRYSVGWQNDLELSDANRLSGGVMRYEERAQFESFGDLESTTTTATNVYVQDRVSLDRHTLVAALGYVDHESFGGHTTWNAEYGFDIATGTRLVASAGTAFRAPDASDRFGFGGNPSLEPEESLTYELGLRHRVDAHQRVTLSAFQTEIDELIVYVVTDPSTFDGELRNFDQARIRGIEAGYELSGNAWQLRAEAIYQEPEDRATGERLLRRANENFTLSYVHTFGSLQLGVDALAAGDRDDFGGVKLDSYVLANFTASYAFNEQWSTQARIENVLDETYALANGYNVADRSVFVGFRYHQR